MVHDVVIRVPLVLTVLAAGTQGAAAQTTYPNVKIAGRMQGQFYWFDNRAYAAAAGPESNFFVRRARIEARGQISENVAVFVQPSFEGGRNLSATTTCSPITIPAGGGTVTPNCRTTGRSGFRLRDAWIEVRLGPETARTAIFLRAGQEKRPFGEYELTSSNNLPSIERGAGAGLPGAASNNLFETHGFLSHDVGAHLRVEQKLDDVRRAKLTLGAYNGQGESVNDVNSRKSFGARGTVEVTPKLQLGAAWFAHDGITPVAGVPDSSFVNDAFNLSASWGKPGDEGLYAVADYMQGEASREAKNTLRGISLVGAYHRRLTNPKSWLYAVEPAFRYDYSDPDTAAGADRITTITAVLGLYVSSKAQLRFAYERQSFQGGSPSVSGLRSALTVSF
ncbi:MAG TPA: porin [Gemmatimonadales bacterium]|nr:porin [Gemmatimonadales bacterium]